MWFFGRWWARLGIGCWGACFGRVCHGHWGVWHGFILSIVRELGVIVCALRWRRSIWLFVWLIHTCIFNWKNVKSVIHCVQRRLISCELSPCRLFIHCTLAGDNLQIKSDQLWPEIPFSSVEYGRLACLPSAYHALCVSKSSESRRFICACLQAGSQNLWYGSLQKQKKDNNDNLSLIPMTSVFFIIWVNVVYLKTNYPTISQPVPGLILLQISTSVSMFIFIFELLMACVVDLTCCKTLITAMTSWQSSIFSDILKGHAKPCE